MGLPFAARLEGWGGGLGVGGMGGGEGGVQKDDSS